MTGGSPDAVRAFNRARLLAAVRQGTATSRAELCAVTGLSRSTVTAFVTELLHDGALIEGLNGAAPDGARGRPVQRLRAAPRTDLVVAVDLGHSHCTVGIVDASGAVLTEVSSALDVDSSAAQTLAHVQRTVAALVREVGPERLCGGALGLPAPVDVRSGSVGPGNVLPRWIHRRPARELEQAIGIPFAIDNDANLGALAEATHGAAQGVQDLIYVKASTGIGAGLVLGGRIHHGANGRAGEIGHVPVDPSGPVCRCGNRGCLETAASVRQVLTALRPRHGEGMTLARVVELVGEVDPGALRVVEDAGRLIGRVLADVVNSLNPEMVVLGGELATAGEPLLAGVHDSVERFTQPGVARDLRIELGRLGRRSELIGAAALAFAVLDRLDQSAVSSM